MDLTTKTIFYCYPEYEQTIEQIEKLILYKAISSHANSYKTQEQISKVIKLCSAVELLKQLKLTVEEILQGLSVTEQELVKIRYFNKPKGAVTDYYTRTYYRNQIRLQKKLQSLLGGYGIDENWFENNCKDIHFLRERYNQLFNQKQQRRQKLDQINQRCEQLNASKVA